MVTRVKGKKHTSTEENSDAGTSRISVNAPKGLKTRFIKKLTEAGLDQRSQSPTIVGWIREYVEAGRGLPPPELHREIADASPEEVRLMAKWLQVYRGDDMTAVAILKEIARLVK